MLPERSNTTVPYDAKLMVSHKRTMYLNIPYRYYIAPRNKRRGVE